MKRNDITIGIVGSGGDGVVAAGDILANTAAHEGLHCMMVKSFGPQIRGGESSCRIRISEGKVHSQGNGLDILVCFSWKDYIKFSSEMDVEQDIVILVDIEDQTLDEDIPVSGGKKRTILKIPFIELAKEAKNPKGKNIIMLGILSELFNLPTDGLKLSIKGKFKKKKKEILDANIASLDIGIKYVKKNFKDFDVKFSYKKKKGRMLLTGNEAVAFGALTAGCRFYSSYPITPASEITESLSTSLPKFGGVVVQAEDEISAICMVTGAAYGGVKAMTATSGPGLSLKSEALGLGAMAELPYVVVDVQRGGPSTGMPTKFEQGDIYQSIYGMHGDAPHAVIAATDVEDCFRTTLAAFNIAESYQMPVILLSDQHLGHRKETVRELDFESVKIAKKLTPRRLSRGGFKRFADTPDGVSPMTWPGVKGGEYLCSGIEHDERGAPTAKYTVHEKMCSKRHKKLKSLENNFKFIRTYGEEHPKIAVVGWGSNKGMIREAVEYFITKGISVGGLIPQLIYPLQKELFKDFLKFAESLVVVENSFGGQFLNYLRSNLDLPCKVLHLKAAGGRCFTVRQVIQEIDKAV